MEGSSINSETCPQLLDLIPREKEWLIEKTDSKSASEEIKKLELRLAPPGQDWSLYTNNTDIKRDESLLSLGSSSVWLNQQQSKPSFLQFPSKTVAKNAQNLPVRMESSQPCCTKVDLQDSSSKIPANTAVLNSSQKRTAPGPVVGWPPIRSFRKNLATGSSSKPATDSQNETPNKKVAGKKPVETCSRGMFVKINMDGVPIGRKVDLNAYDSYEKLSAAVDELFRGLLAAQRDSSTGSTKEEEKVITGILDGSGEYTLVYEDNEGDRMLVGDVPWHMFVSTVKRLRVLKSSEVSALSLGTSKQDKVPVE